MSRAKANEALIQEAVAWAERGISVFPCRHDKKPLTEHGFYDAETDPNKVRALFEFYGNDAVMIGGRMGGGIFAIDVDLYKPGADAWYKAAVDEGALPETRVHETKSGGIHLLYEGDAASAVIAPGVDVKGEGGYIILPGTPGYTVRQTGIAEAPPRLVELIRHQSRAQKASTTTDLEHQVTSADSFHEPLALLAARKAAAGMDHVDILLYLQKVLNSSVAAAPQHPRHARWHKIVGDDGGELSRIAYSAHIKYNRDSEIERHLLEVEPGILDAIENDAGALFPNLAREAVMIEPDGDVAIPDEWPFIGKHFSEDEELEGAAFSIYPIVVDDEVSVMFAEPKSGKTAIALTLGLHLATGIPFGEFKIPEPGAVLYFALEGTRAINLRRAAWKKTILEGGHVIPDNPPFFSIEQSMSFYADKARDQYAKKIKIAEDWYIKRGYPKLRLIVIDTLTRAMSGGDQNSAEDTAKLFSIVSAIRAYGIRAHVMFVHHKARTGGVRGSTNIEAEPDVLFDVSKDKNTVSLKIARARSIEDGGSYHFRLTGIELGNNQQGFPQSGVLPVPITAPADPHERAEVMVPIDEARLEVMQLGPGLHVIQKVMAILRSKNLTTGPRMTAASSKEGRNLLSQMFPNDQLLWRNTHIVTVEYNGDVPNAVNIRLIGG